jgi:putative peptidoglycan lipid II flippase
LTKSDFASARYLAVNATVATACRGLGVASGIVLDAVIVGFFGLSHQTDAYFAALAIPSLIANTVDAQGPKVLVPFFAQGFEQDGRQATWKQLRNVLTTCGLLFLAVAVVLTAGAWLLMPLQVPGLDPEAVRLAIQLEMILAWIVLTQGLCSVMTGALYADHHYLATTTSGITTNLVTIAFVVLYHDRLGIRALALGLVAGSCAQLAVLICVAGRRGFRLGRGRLRDPRVTRIMGLGVYPLLGQALSGSNVFLENALGSLLGAGALSAVRYANRVVASVAGVLVGGLVTTSLPILSHCAAGRRFEDMKEALMKTMRFIALLAVPIGLWLIFAGKPLIALAFERGRFTNADSARVGLLLSLLAPYVLASRIVGVAELAFYATTDMRTPLWATAAFLSTYFALSLSLLPRLGVYAFAMGTSVAAILTAYLMLRLVTWRFGSLPWADSRQFGRRLASVAAISTFGFLVGMAINSTIVDGGPLANVARLFIVTGMGLSAFVGSAVFVRLINWGFILDTLRPRRMKKVANAPA